VHLLVLTRKLVDVRGPGRPHHAAEQLRLLAGNSHELHSAIVVARDGKIMFAEVGIVRMIMRHLNQSQTRCSHGFPCLAGDDRPSIRATASKIKSAVRSLDAFENELDRHLKSDRLFLISSLPR